MAEQLASLTSSNHLDKYVHSSKKVVGIDDNGNTIYEKWIDVTIPTTSDGTYVEAYFDTGETLNKVYSISGYTERNGTVLPLPFVNNAGYVADVLVRLNTYSDTSKRNKLCVYSTGAGYSGNVGQVRIVFR
jgi:hypothetical protein